MGAPEMALKTKDIRALNAEDRAKTLRETRAELMHQRGLAAMGGAVKNPGQIRDLRTTIARILTIEHQLGEDRPGAIKGVAKTVPRGGRPAPAKAAKAPAKAAAKPAPKPATKAAPKTKKPGGA